ATRPVPVKHCAYEGSVNLSTGGSVFFSGEAFEANSYPYSMKMSGKKGRNGLSAVGLLFSDRLHGSAVD
ncbi:MAG: hypothetical protein ABW185_29005, partial [Sedimenticola sp.]